MNPVQIETPLAEIVRKNARLEVRSIEPDQTLTGNLGYDSLAFLMLLSDLEEAFGVVFPLDRIDELQDLTFRRLVDLVSAHAAGGTTRAATAGGATEPINDA